MPEDVVDNRKFPLLKYEDGWNNYGDWSIKAKRRWVANGRWKYVGGELSTPPVIPELRPEQKVEGLDDKKQSVSVTIPGNEAEVAKLTEEHADWFKNDALAMDDITSACPSEFMHLVKRAKSASEAWNKLSLTLQPANTVRSISLAQKIRGYRCHEDYNVATWLDDLERMRDRLCDIDPDAISDQEYAKLIVNLMPLNQNWRNFVGTLRRQLNESPDTLSYVEVIHAIREEYWAQNEDNPEILAGVFTAKAQAEKRRRQYTGNEGSHQAKRARPDDIPKSRLQCTNQYCKRMGHTIDDCITYGGKKAGQYPDWWKGPRNLHLKPGSAGREAPSNASSSAQTPKKLTRAYATTVNDRSEYSGDKQVDHSSEEAQVNSLLGNHFALNVNVLNENEPIRFGIPVVNQSLAKTNAVYHDSGANRHVCWDRSVFSDYQEIPPIKVCGFGDGLAAAAIGKGSVELEARLGPGTNNTLTLTDVLHIPEARSNLISQSQLDKKGVAAVFDGRGNITLRKGGADIACGRLSNDLYRLDLTMQASQDANIHSVKTNLTGDFYTA